MTVNISGAYSLLVRYNERTKAFLDESRAHHEQFFNLLASSPSAVPHEMDLHQWMALVDDGELMSVPAAMNPGDLESLLERLTSEGLVHHVDFVVTASGSGVVDPMPLWLEVVEPDIRYRLRRPDD